MVPQTAQMMAIMLVVSILKETNSAQRLAVSILKEIDSARTKAHSIPKDSMKAQHWVEWRLTEKHLADVKELDWLKEQL